MSDHYQPMVDPLHEALGVEFLLWDTGGGCQALIGEFEGDVAVYITDSTQSPFGEECMITDQPTRDMLGEKMFGFAIGVYRDGGSDQVAYREYPRASTRDLPRLVREVLKVARNEPEGAL